MKKNAKKLLVMVMLMAASCAMAAVSDALLMFSSKGPDCYADGTPVQEGECYALVWVRDGTEFAGIDMHGNAVDTNNNEVVVALPLAKARRDGAVRCPRTIFYISNSNDYVNVHSNGTFALVLLDTREENEETGELVASGNPKRVNGWGLVGKHRLRVVMSDEGIVEGVTVAEATERVTANESSAVPADVDVPKPKITSIKVQNGMVVLTVIGTTEKMLYNIASGSHPGWTTT